MKEKHILANAQAFGDRVVVKRDLPAKQSEGGILLPDTAQDKVQTGTVISVGRGRWCDSLGRYVTSFLSIGERVVITTYAGSGQKDDSEYVCLREDDILAVLPK